MNWIFSYLLQILSYLQIPGPENFSQFNVRAQLERWSLRRPSPKIMIVNMFEPEKAVFTAPLELYKNFTVPGLSPRYPHVNCNDAVEICQVTVGEGEINAAASLSGLIFSSSFNLKNTYFVLAGIAGIDPSCGTLGSITLPLYAIQVGLAYAISESELESNYTTIEVSSESLANQQQPTQESQTKRIPSAGYFALGTKGPGEYPVFVYGTEAFELSAALRDSVFSAMQNSSLRDSKDAASYRSRFLEAAAKQPPEVIKVGVSTTSDAFFHGKVIGDAFANYVGLLTNGSAEYCVTAQEDNALSAVLVRGAVANVVDFNRVVLMRAASNFDRPFPGATPAQQLFWQESGGFPIALDNLLVAGKVLIEEILNNWHATYRGGLIPTNYVGDLDGTLKGPFKPNIGSPESREG